MKIVIDIPEEIYKAKQHLVANPKRMMDAVDIAIVNGIPLPRKHGRLIDADELWQKLGVWLKPSKPDEAEMVDLAEVIASVMMEIKEMPTIIDGETE